MAPTQEAPAAPPINPLINNQVYNNDLLNSFALTVFFTGSIIFMSPIAIINNLDLMPTLADCFGISIQEFLGLFSQARDLIQNILTGFVLPLTVMLCSSELRPFLISVILCRWE